MIRAVCLFCNNITELIYIRACCPCHLRQCATNQYLRKRDDPHRYCQDACADVTRCGPVIVPQHHLQVGTATDCNKGSSRARQKTE